MMPNENAPDQTTEEEAQERARAWTERMKAEGRLDPFDPIEFVVSAERERCARIADEVRRVPDGDTSETAGAWRLACSEISQRIRCGR